MKPLVKCQICNVSVRQDRLDKHMQNVHSSHAQLSFTESNPLTEPSKSSTGREVPLVKCHVCGHSVQQKKLQKHMKSKHPLNYKNIQRIQQKSLAKNLKEKQLSGRNKHSRNYKDIQQKLLAKILKEKQQPSERSIWWIYKCNSRQLHYQNSWGDWYDFFFDDPNQQWGSTDGVPALAELNKGDMIIAYQTDRNELVGIAQVRQSCEYDSYLYLDPIEVIRVKVRPLKEANPRIAAIPALQPGPIKTIYDISKADAKRLLIAAGSTFIVGK